MADVPRPVALVMLSVLCGQFLALGLHQAGRDSVAVDEAVDLTAGLVAVERRDLRMVPEHALALPVLAGILPASMAEPILPDTVAYDDGDWFDYADDLIRANAEAGRLDRVVFWFRVVPLLLGALTGVFLYALAGRLVNRAGGLVAAGLWLTTPYVLGLAHLSSLDITFTAAVIALALSVDRWRESKTDRRVFVVAIGLGACLLSRHTAIVLVPVVVLTVFVLTRGSDRRDRFRQLGVALLVPLAVVWVGYRLVDPTPVSGTPRDRFDALIDGAAAEGPARAVALAVPMPVEWRAGLAYLVETSAPRPAYLLGESWTGSRPWYFPVSAAVKLPFSAFLGLVAGGLAWAWAPKEDRRRAAVVLGAPAVAVFSLLLCQPLNIGLRLAIPVLALGFGATAALGRGFGSRWFAVAVGILFVGQATASVVAYPTSLAWTPPPFSDGYRAVSDGTIDLGQANRATRERHRASPFVAASLTAPRGDDVLDDVPTVEDSAPASLIGLVAVSASELTIRHRDELAWLRAYCPVDVIDDAVLVYRFDEAPDLEPGSGTPARPCEGSVSVRE